MTTTNGLTVARPVSIQELIDKASVAYRIRFPEHVATIAAVSPGRVALIGHHTDYNEGYVLPMAVPLYTVIVGGPNGTSKCNLLSQAVEKDNEVTIDLSTSLEKGEPHWANYVRGVMAFYHDKLVGFDAVIVSTVPLGGGLSSSASLEVATYLFLDGLTASTSSPSLQHSTRKDKAVRCQKAEHMYADVPCGLMDQFVCMLGKEGSVILIDCRSQDYYYMALHDADLVVVVINSHVKHQLTGSEYSERRYVCEDAVKSTGVTLRDMTYVKYTEVESKMDPVTSRRVRHVVCENWRVLRVFEALKNKDYVEAGKMLYDSHKSLRDDFEVSCYELDQLVDITRGVMSTSWSTHPCGCRDDFEVSCYELDQLVDITRGVMSTSWSTHPCGCRDDFEVSCYELDQVVDITRGVMSTSWSTHPCGCRDDFEVSCYELDQLVDITRGVMSTSWSTHPCGCRDDFEVSCYELDQLVDITRGVMSTSWSTHPCGCRDDFEVSCYELDQLVDITRGVMSTSWSTHPCGCRDDFEVSCYELDQLVDITRGVDGVYGCCMTGAGFGGCMVGLCRRASVPILLNKVKTEFDGKPTFYVFDSPADGAHWMPLPPPTTNTLTTTAQVTRQTAEPAVVAATPSLVTNGPDAGDAGPSPAT